METVDAIVVGAGVVGLAVARELALQGQEVLLLESAQGIGTGTSSRNSEVIHAGIYYPQGSLKAELCVRGKALLYAYCDARSVGYRRCGKLIVATSAQQLGQLEQIRHMAAANGVTDLHWLSADQAAALEPSLSCVAALHSPSTGIVDSHALMLALQGDMENAGGVLALESALASVSCTPDGIELTAADGTCLRTRVLVNSAGLYAPDLARSFKGFPEQCLVRAYYAKGNYFTLAGRSPFSHLIYPVPEGAGLGVHLTLDLGGQAKFGPDVQWVDSPVDLLVDPVRGDGFYAEVRKYWPALQDGALSPGYAGIRPKLKPPQDGSSDFVIQGPAVHGIRGLVNLFGIESPGLTSSLAIAQRVMLLLRS